MINRLRVIAAGAGTALVAAAFVFTIPYNNGARTSPFFPSKQTAPTTTRATTPKRTAPPQSNLYHDLTAPRRPRARIPRDIAHYRPVERMISDIRPKEVGWIETLEPFKHGDDFYVAGDLRVHFDDHGGEYGTIVYRLDGTIRLAVVRGDCRYRTALTEYDEKTLSWPGSRLEAKPYCATAIERRLLR